MNGLVLEKNSRAGRRFFFFALLVTSLVVFFGLMQTSIFQKHARGLTLGMLLDLMITLPLIYWALLPKSEKSELGITSVWLVGLLFATYLIPSSQVGLIVPFQIGFATLIAVGILVMSIRRTKACLLTYNTTPGHDRKQRLESSILLTFGSGKVNRWLANELSAFVYLFAKSQTDSKSKSETEDKSKSFDAPIESDVFTYHEKSGMTAALIAFCMAIFVEIIAVHVLVSIWSVTLAWIASVSSLYFALFVFAHIRSIRFRPIYVTDDHLVLRNGLLMSSEIPLNNIDRIELTGATPDSDKTPLSFAIPSGANVVLHLKIPSQCELLYGMKSEFQTALLHIDDRDKFSERCLRDRTVID